MSEDLTAFLISASILVMLAAFVPCIELMARLLRRDAMPARSTRRKSGGIYSREIRLGADPSRAKHIATTR